MATRSSLFPGESHGQRGRGGYSSRCRSQTLLTGLMLGWLSPLLPPSFLPFFVSAHPSSLLPSSSSFLLVIAVQLLSRIQLFATPWTAAHQAPLPSAVSRSLLRLLCSERVAPSNHLALRASFSFALSLFCRVSSSESALPITRLRYGSFCLSQIISNLLMVCFCGDVTQLIPLKYSTVYFALRHRML